MKKRFIIKAVTWAVLLLMIAGCKASSNVSESTDSKSGPKASSTEQKIVGKWNAGVGQEAGKTTFFDGWIELKDDLTGSSSFVNSKSFTWSYKEMMEGQYYFDINANGNHSGLLYDESRDLLSLVIPPDTFIMFDRK